MASTEPESAKPVAAPPTPPPPSSPCSSCSALDLSLRVLLFAAAVTSVVVMVTSKQTELVPTPTNPLGVPTPAKFNHSPAFIYFVAALSVAGLYSIVTILASLAVLLNPALSKKFLIYFAFWDVIMLGIVASATGTAGGVAYIGLKGNTHVRWTKVCNIYDKFCRHVGSSVAVSLFAAVVLVFLCKLSIISLYKRIRD